ncbi:MAG: glycosyltransferase family 87 protein [Rubrobacteraceae bacterium]
MRRPAVLLLLPFLLFIFGFTSGNQMSVQGVISKVDNTPSLADIVSKPTVETSASYVPTTDTWQAVLTESASGTPVARATVADDTGKVGQVKILPEGKTISYPTLTKGEAEKLAAANQRIRQELSQYGTYITNAEYANGQWTVHFWIKKNGADQEVARAGINDNTWVFDYVYTGDQVSWQLARGDNGAYGKEANYWYIWGPLALVFALAFFRNDKVFSLRNLDVLAMLGFLVSHYFFRNAIPQPAVLLWYPPLIYLFFRTLLMGFGIGERVERTSNFPTPVLFVLAALAAGLVLYLNLDSRVIDVGYAGVAGGQDILNGLLPYGNMPPDVGTGDTYGPLNYLLYIPFIWLFGYSGQWDFLPAAHALTDFAFVGGAMALIFAGWRLAGPKGAAALVFAWSVFPYTLYTTNNNANDIVVAAVLAVGLALATSPLGRGAAVLAGFSVKLFPLLLVPLWMFHDGRKRSSLYDFVLGGAVIIAISFWVLFLNGHPIESAKLFYEKTLAFQGRRKTPWTIFTQLPELEFLKRPLQAATIVLALVVIVFPRKRTVRRLAALSAAIILIFQLTTNYWFYTYITWFEPFIFLALLPATNEKTPLDGTSDEQKKKAKEQHPIEPAS